MHLINPEVELDLPTLHTLEREQGVPDTALTNVLELLERQIVRNVRCHGTHPNLPHQKLQNLTYP